MPRYLKHYEFDPAKERVSCGCGWEGRGSEMAIELFDELCDLECPRCHARLIVIPYPTAEETREAAAAGNKRAQEELVQLEATEARWARADRVALKKPSQLPKLEGTVDVVWDFEKREDEVVTILRAGGRILWEELAYWEGIDRFEEVAQILRKRYGSQLRSITPTRASEVYLYGDTLSAPDVVDRINAQLSPAAEGG